MYHATGEAELMIVVVFGVAGCGKSTIGKRPAFRFVSH